MNKIITAIIIMALSGGLKAQKGVNPIIKNFGTIYEIENAVMPDASLEYKIVVDLKTLQKDKSEINAGLNNVARMMNLHGLGGVKPENLKVVLAIHGGATEIILDDEAYRKKNNTNNPNLELFKELKDAGVDLYVCGQSLIARNYKQSEVNPDIKIGLSMLTVVTTHMLNGYHQMVFN